MKQFLTCLLYLVSFLSNLHAQTHTPAAENLVQRNQFQDMKFGLFIHWGASCVLGHGEWVMNNRNIQVNDYNRLINIFNPTSFDAKQWVMMAKNAGMKYITFITRHHDGFSNWDTQQSDWKITKTAYGKDVLKQLADECHKEGIKLFCYYSLLDWYRSDYQYETGRTGKGTGRTEKSNWENYIRFMKAQLTELLTNYGEIAGIWFDGHWDQTAPEGAADLTSKVNWHYDEIYSLIHQLQPQCLIGNNHHQSPFNGEDFQMFEKDLPGQNHSGLSYQQPSENLPLETCETMNNSWGYNITDRSYKSVKQLIHYIVNAAGRNANFLLNVGPMANGIIQPEFRDTLKAVGDWMKLYGETIYSTRGNIIEPQDWGVVTGKGQSLYVHVLKPAGKEYIFIPGMKQKISSAFLYAGKKKLKYKQLPEGVFIYLDGIEMNTVDTVIELKL